MTVSELISTLQELDGDLEVRIGSQQNWPFEYSISQIWQDEQEEYNEAVYLVEGSQLGYFTKRAWE